ncbi:hypothetical protein BOV90_04340 [Solemya velum gill symbiont]|uniref:Uncharacterized protein n=1 Tax=Solemya velum gill symbiont TaxID=2340 RepID=A0A0B0HC09_SOVGS|nr:hypothetical protein JV46_04500 [Solemya velum gill symbiont]OOY34625.1 hypothetical protein BOV88_09235 [Solemya velum gill symbiont]OOY37417.1 hypothetical protein BOV89_07665 [Solemya velum gill symbiont]OOY40403.1 hypothetical protein BOV90_04340 [Solemya velum gill symbiont]OOY42897.1 hypothetical protein BOV91_05555 [Solemya velum gill symbiont]
MQTSFHFVRKIFPGTCNYFEKEWLSTIKRGLNMNLIIPEMMANSRKVATAFMYNYFDLYKAFDKSQPLMNRHQGPFSSNYCYPAY